ncbi:MAG: trypsin-like peptidase domain-containing protein [Acidobacteria bacterium]|nr:trypsin-like peptidase domain-containing protein [Acidobacteriota bacterium]
MKSFLVLVILLLLSVGSVWAQNANKSPGAIAREQGQAVVIVEALDDRGSVIGQGSGFIVTANGAIVTNLHVVQGAATLRIKLPSGDVYKTTDLVDVDDVKDIAIIKIKGFKLPTVTLGDSDKAETGDSVVAISSPEGLVNSLTTGVISGVRRLETHRVFQITAPISRGSSGGALFNSNGEVIGVVTSLLKSGQNINFAVPINYARGMISDQATTSLAKLQPLPKPEPENKTEDIYNTDQPIQSQIVTATRGKLGLTEQEPVFVRPDEALALFYRLVAGIGLYNFKEVGDQTRTAALVKTSDSDEAEEFTIKYLSFRSGLAMNFAKPDRLLTSVELLVTWSVEDLKNTFGDKFKKRTVNKQQILDFGKLPGGQNLTATMDGNGNVRSVKFTKAK